jgi:drug/metabolite transporter (DMT)-like permease
VLARWGRCWQPERVHRRTWILIGLLSSLWGASYLFMKVALDDVGPAFIVFARCALAALVLVPVALAAGAWEPVRRHLPTLALVAGVQIAVPFLLIAIGQQHIPSATAGILVASAPIFTSIIAVLAVHEDRLPPAGLAGVAVGMAGVVLLLGVDLGGDGAAAFLGGALILVAALGYAVGALLAKRRLSDVPPVGLTATIMALSALATLPAAPFAAPTTGPGLDTIGALLALGLGGTGAAFLVFYVLNAEIGPSRASVVAYIAPAFSVLYGVTLLDEAFTAATAGGLALILAGSWVAANGALPRRRRVAVGAA